MSTPSEKSNLARIRENQRRSRARRREYVQELEQRLRLVEIQGIEASAEIQVVARKVAEENKKLRLLLNKKGVENDSIDSFLASGAVQSPHGGGGIGSSRALTSSLRNNDIQELEQLLIPRRPSWCEISSSSDMVGDERMADSSVLIRSTREPPMPLSPVGSSSLGIYCDNTSYSDHSSSRNSLPDDGGFAQLSVSEHHQQRTLSPTMSIARSSSLSTSTEADHQHSRHHHHHHHHQPRYYSTGYTLSDNNSNNPASPHEISYSYGIEPLHSPYQQQQQQQQQHHPQRHYQHGGISSLSSAQSYSSSRGDSISSGHGTISSPTTTANSCSMAANVISSMVGADPFEVRATLGCAPGVDCMIDNRTVSEAIDHLTASALDGGGVYK